METIKATLQQEQCASQVSTLSVNTVRSVLVRTAGMLARNAVWQRSINPGKIKHQLRLVCPPAYRAGLV
jgi:hypothetical protein